MNTDLAAQRAIDRLDKSGFDTLSDNEKTLVAVWCTAAGVGNNGFLGYYKGKRGDLAQYAPAAFKKIGAKQMAGIIAEANAVLKPAGPDQDRGTRKAQMLDLDATALRQLEKLEERFFACVEDEDELLEVFLNPKAPAG